MSVKKLLSNYQTVQLNGVERKMRLDFNAFAYLEDTLKMPALDGTLFSEANMKRANVLRAILWACMNSAGEEITLEEVGSGMTINNLEELMGAVAALVSGSTGTEEGGEKGK